MPQTLRGPLTVLGRLMLCAIFLLAAGNDIPNFEKTKGMMERAGVPAPSLLLVGAVVFLIAGGLSVILGYRARIGAALLLVFLVLATYYFHDFWNLEEPKRQEQMIQFMKNLSMAGATVFLIANGSGPMSLDAWLAKPADRSAGRRDAFAQAG
jgi:putative oxidoreductase